MVKFITFMVSAVDILHLWLKVITFVVNFSIAFLAGSLAFLVQFCYLMTRNFCDTFQYSRICGAHFSRHLNSTILGKFCLLNHFNFVFLTEIQFISLTMLLKHVLEFSKLQET